MMINFEKFSKLNLFYKIIIFEIIAIIPVVFTGFSVYNNGVNSIRQTIIRTLEVDTETAVNNLEDETNRIKRMQTDLVNDRNINEFQMLYNAEDSLMTMQYFMQIDKKLKNEAKISTLISDITVYFLKSNILISSEQGFNNITEIDKMIIRQSLTSDYEYLFIGDKIYVKSVIQSYDNNMPNCVICIRINQEQLLHMVGKDDGNSTKFLVSEVGDNELSLIGNGSHPFNEFTANMNNKNDDARYKGIFYVIQSKEKHIVTFLFSKYMGLYMISYTNAGGILDVVYSYVQQWILLLTFIITFMFAVTLFIYNAFYVPLEKLLQAFKKVESNDMDISIKHKKNDEFQYIYQGFNEMLERIKKLIEKAYKNELLAKNAQYKQLQAQINPHFLYNTFFLISGMAQIEDCDSVKALTKLLGSYYEYITKNQTDEVLLIKEYTHTLTYLEIQGYRFSSKVDMQVDELPEEYENIVVPRLIIQPLVENSFKHALEKKMREGILSIKFLRDYDMLKITISDNAENLTQEIIQEIEAKLNKFDDNNFEKTSLYNINSRLKFFYNNPMAGIKVKTNEMNGLTVILCIPLLKKEGQLDDQYYVS